MDTYRVTLTYPEANCAHGLVVDAASAQDAEQGAIEQWNERKASEYPGPDVAYHVTKIEKKELTRFHAVRWVELAIG